MSLISRNFRPVLYTLGRLRVGARFNSSESDGAPAPTPGQSSAFKSGLSLDKIYPNSSLDLARKVEPPQTNPTDQKFSGYIPMEKLKITYSRSSGPGGQNVNVLSTKVDVRFELETATWIPDVIRENMKKKLRNSLTKDGWFFLTSDRTRTQQMNLADALEKIRETIRSCEPIQLAQPDPETIEHRRRKQEKAARERLREKRDRGMHKSSRGAVSTNDF